MAYANFMLNHLAEKEFDAWETGYTGDTYRLVLETFDKDGDSTGNMEAITEHFSSSSDCCKFYNELVSYAWDHQDLREIIQREVHDREVEREIRIYCETEWFEDGESDGSEYDLCATLRLYWRNEKPIIQWKRSEIFEFRTGKEEIGAYDNLNPFCPRCYEKDVGTKTGLDVVLSSAGRREIAVAKTIRRLTGLGLKDVVDAVHNVPSIIAKNAKLEDAESLKRELEEVGATVNLM